MPSDNAIPSFPQPPRPRVEDDKMPGSRLGRIDGFAYDPPMRVRLSASNLRCRNATAHGRYSRVMCL
jgi:hypothetical protein